MPQPTLSQSNHANPFQIKIVQEIEGIKYFMYCFAVLKYLNTPTDKCFPHSVIDRAYC